MPTDAHSPFPGIPRDALAFLTDLGLHNAKPWFEENKERYKAQVVAPLAGLVAALTPRMTAIDPFFDPSPRVGRAISRIHRDVRFSRDKSPYRTSAWIVFKRPGKQWTDRPAFFFEITLEGWRHGMGFYMAPLNAMRSFRQAVLDAPDDFRRIADELAKAGTFRLGGDRYARPRVPDAPEGLEDWLIRKSFYLVRESPLDERLFSADLPDMLAEDFERAAPLYRFVNQALDARRG